MSLIPDAEELDAWRGFLTRRFVAASQSEKDYVAAAKKAWAQSVKWIESNAKDKGSFRWVCDFLDLEPDAVRRAAKEKGKLEDLL